MPFHMDSHTQYTAIYFLFWEEYENMQIIWQIVFVTFCLVHVLLSDFYQIQNSKHNYLNNKTFYRYKSNNVYRISSKNYTF